MNIRFKTHNLRHGKKFYAPPTGDTSPEVSKDACNHAVFQTIGQPFSLSQRERAGVRESRPNENSVPILGKGESNGGCLNRKSQIANRKSEKGIALVITLILLSVTLVMAIAFLAISNRERNSVSTVMDTAVAKDASEAGLAQAEAQIISQIQVSNNPYISSLLVSTNYISHYGFVSGSASLTNVNYDYYSAGPGGPMGNSADLIQNVANLFYSPRVPVFVPLGNGSYDFRYYLDLNRNGKYDTNGVDFITENFDEGNNDMKTASREIGDPEWIGILEHPDQPHGPNNPFVARFCFIAVPADSLDLNYIHNQVLDPFPAYGNSGQVQPNLQNRDGYYRNQGVGTWEINLAAFLADLNTNRWDVSPEPYEYPVGSSGVSYAIDDARALVASRYANLYSTLASADSMFGGLGTPGDVAFRNNGIDYYTVAPLQMVFDTNYAGFDNPTMPWVGAQNTNQFFSSPSELFDPGKSWPQFTNNLISAGISNSTYNRYTFTRLLSQLGTDSQAESGQINLNYSNALVNYDLNGVPTSITVIPGAETNFVPWTPTNFFLAAADKMLRAYSAEWYESSPSNYVQTYYGLTLPYLTNGLSNVSGWGVTNVQHMGQTNQIPSFGITNIPVYINGQFVYTPAVNRLIQLAANIYDATTTNNNVNPSSGLMNYPSVFRPIFWTTNEPNPLNPLGPPEVNVYIKGYQYVGPITPNSSSHLFSLPTEVTSLTAGTLIATNVWGVPWIVGAKKGFPNFNAFELDNTFFVERFLQFNRNTSAGSGSTFPYGRVYSTNQMYFMGISNLFGVEHWNSYASNYLNPVTIVAQNVLSVGFSNDVPFSIVNNFSTNGYIQNLSPWMAQSFEFPLGSNTYNPQNLANNGPPSTNNLYIWLDGSGIKSTNINGTSYTAPCFVPVTAVESGPPSTAVPYNYMNSGTPQLPQFGLSTTNRLQAYIEDTRDPNNIYILDYVQLGGMNNSLGINQAIADPDSSGMWSTNTVGGANTPYGVVNQFLVSLGGNFPGADADQSGGTGGGGWSSAPVPGAGTDTSPAAQQAFFHAFFTENNQASYTGNSVGYLTNIQLSVQAPFTSMRKVVETFAYQANDPLVHYITSDLNDRPDTKTNRVSLSTVATNGLKYLGRASDRYMPWSVVGKSWPAGQAGYDGNGYNMSYRDPLVWASDNWDFPTNKFPNVGWLGRVHRGTPWQTVYLKSTNLMTLTTVINNGPTVNAGVPTWQLWTGNANAGDAYNAAPVQDRLLFDLFTTAPDENATRGQLSVNVGADDPNNPLAGLAAWSALLSGTLAFSNNEADLPLTFYKAYESPIGTEPQPSYGVFTNQPLGAGPYPGTLQNPAASDITNAAMWKMVASINGARTNFVGIDGLHGVYEHVGDILSANGLSDASPYLDSADATQQKYGISDEMYEWMPQQIMSLLTVSGTPQSPPRYVIYCYGQALKPAPNGVVENAGQFFDLITNYQVTAESASRAVIRIDNAPTPANPTATPHIVIEQFNPLPPD